MNYRLLYKLISFLILIICAFMVIPALMALYFEENHVFFSFVAVIFPCTLILAPLVYKMRNTGDSVLSTRDGFFLVTSVWFLASVTGSLPYFLSGAIPSFFDAFFETVSGFSTTGASILTSVEGLPRSLLFWRSLTHWLGGMGIIVLAVAVLPLLGIGGLQLIKAEAPGPTVDKITPRITQTAKILWLIYSGFTLLQTILLMAGGMGFFDALTHSFGTLATGGFSTKNASIAHYNSTYIDTIITIFMFMAGVNFILHYKMLFGGFTGYLRDNEFILYTAILLLSSTGIALSLFLGNYYDFSNSMRHAFFQAASILTTTGYSTADYELWPSTARIILFALMFTGGCAGSTGGGIKIIRLLILLKQSLNEMKLLLHPRGVFTLSINGKPVRKNIVYSVAGFFFLYICLVLAVTVILAFSGTDLSTALSASLACIGNIGPGFGMVGPAETYAFFPDYIKLILSVAMIIGRLEIYTVLVLFTPLFWKK